MRAVHDVRRGMVENRSHLPVLSEVESGEQKTVLRRAQDTEPETSSCHPYPPANQFQRRLGRWPTTPGSPRRDGCQRADKIEIVDHIIRDCAPRNSGAFLREQRLQG